MDYARNPSPIPGRIRCPSQPLKPYNRSHMQPAPSTRIPDGFLAAMRLEGEKPHQGLPSRNPAPNPVREVCKFTVLLGMRGQAELNRAGSCCTGKERDAESGNDYFGARYYSSAMGRFMSPDWSVKIEPVPYSKLDDPQSLNLYAYVLNNPLGETDPDGHADEHSPPWLSSKAREYIFAALHPGIAHQIGTVVPHQGVTNISTNAVRFSTDLGLQENASHEGSQVNAVRHTIWSATMTSKWGSDVAQGVGNAHEDNPNVDLSIRTFTGKNAMDQADQSVDLLNNQIGQQIGSDHPDQSMPELTSAVLDYYHTNGLYTATPGADGTVNISQTKLSDQQYQSAKQSLSKMNDNGFKQ